VVLSTLSGACFEAMQHRKTDEWRFFKIDPLSVEEKEIMISHYMSQYAKTLSTTQLQKIAAAPQTQNPLYLRTVLEEIRVFGTYEQLDTTIDGYLATQTIPILFEKVLQRIETDFETDNKGLLGDILCTIYVSRRGLAENEILEILNISQNAWSPIYIALEEMLVNRSGLLTFFHDYLRQIVETRYLQKSDFIYEKYRIKIIDYFSNLAKQNFLEGKIPSSRTIEEWPYQLLQIRKWEQMTACITDLDMFSILKTDNFRYDLYKYWRENKDPNKENQLIQNIEKKASSLNLNNVSNSEATQSKLLEITKKFSDIGIFFREMVANESSEKMLTKAMNLLEKYLPNHPSLPEKLSDLAFLYRLQGLYEKSTNLYKKLVDNLNQKSAKNKDNEQLAELAASLNALAATYRYQGKYNLAQPLYERGLKIRKEIFGEDNEAIAQSYNSLGVLYRYFNIK
jgi:tetratricopeptide (TPR) repeat protein